MVASEKGPVDGIEQVEHGVVTPPYGTEKNTPASDSEDDAQFEFTIWKFIAILSLQIGYMAAVFSIQMVSAILSTINADIGPSTAFAWMSTAQVIPVAVFGPLVGSLGDIYGRRTFILLGNAFGVIGCAVGATATTVNTAIAGGIFIGCASACQQLAWSGLAELVPKKYRGLALGLFELSCIPPGAFGPIMGNAIATYATWRWVYWVPFILNSVGLIMVFIFYRPKNQYIKEEGRTRLQEIVDLDWIGIFLYATGIVLFLLGISFGGNQFEWSSPAPIAMIVIGLVLLIALGIYEAMWEQVFPLFPAAVLGNIRGVTLVLVGTFLYGMLFYSVAILWPLQVSILYTSDLISIGWYASTLGIAGIATSPVFGYLFTKGYARIQFVFIIALGTVAAGTMAIVSPTSHIASTCLVALMGVSIGGGMIIATAMIQMEVSHEYLGIATSLAITARNLGGSVGAVIYVSIFTDRLKHYIMPYLVLPLFSAGVDPGSIEGAVLALTGTGPVSALAALTPAQLEIGIMGVKLTFSHSLRIVYLSSIAFGVIGTVAVCFCRNVDHLMTNKVEIQLDEGAKFVGVTDTGEGHIIRTQELEALRHHRRGHVNSSAVATPRPASPATGSKA